MKLELSGVQARGRNLLRKDVFIEIPAGDELTIQIPLALPDGTAPGETTLEIELRFEDGIRVVPTRGMLSFELVRRPFARLFRATGQAVLFLVLLLLALSLIAVLVLYVRGLHRRSEEPLVAAVLDSEAAAAEERRQALAAARQEGPARVTTEEARAYAAGLVPKHVTEDEAQLFQSDLLPKHVTDEEAHALEADRLPKHVTADEAKLFAESRSITEEEAARYRDETARSAAEALANFAAATSTHRSMNAAESRPMEYKPLIKQTGSLRVEFRVEDQTPYIGLRNIRTLHSGGKKSIGGKRSDFLVFLVPVPARVAEVYYDGEDLTLVPLRPEFFPDYKGPISGCLSRKVQMVSRHGKVLTISFSRYIPPVDRLNRLLHCVDAPGLLENGDTRNDSGSGLA